MGFDHLQPQPVFCRRLLARVALVHIRELDVPVRRLLQGPGQIPHLRMILFVGRRHFERQQTSQRVHRRVNLGSVEARASAALGRGLERSAVKETALGTAFLPAVKRRPARSWTAPILWGLVAEKETARL